MTKTQDLTKWYDQINIKPYFENFSLLISRPGLEGVQGALSGHAIAFSDPNVTGLKKNYV